MLVLENNLFTEVAIAESATVSGGQSEVDFNLPVYLFILGAGTVFGQPGLTNDELQYAWEKAIVVDGNNNNNNVAL